MKHDQITLAASEIFVENILRNRHNYEWDLQGFGMLRTRPTAVARLNIWDSYHQYDPKPSMIHDHPWSFGSLIVSGLLTNTKYSIERPNGKIGTAMVERTIRPGQNPAIIGEDKLVNLRVYSVERLDPGESYYQEWDVVHETEYTDGTITLNVRDRGNRPDTAHVYFPQGETWKTAEPRAATKAEIDDICERALSLRF